MPRQNQEKIRFVGEQLLLRSDRDQRARCEAAEFVLVHFPDCVELASRQTAILQQYVALGRSPQTGDALTAGLRPREKRAQILPAGCGTGSECAVRFRTVKAGFGFLVQQLLQSWELGVARRKIGRASCRERV